MKALDIDLELLIQSFSFNEDELGKEYLDTITGEIINIPREVNKVIYGEKEIEELDEWEKYMLEDGYKIKGDKENRYMLIPTMDIEYLHEVMIGFVKEKVSNEEVKVKLLNAINNSEAMRNFKNVLYKYEKELYQWEEYEDERLKRYVINWLKNIEIILK